MAGAGEACNFGVLLPQMHSFVHCGVSGLGPQFSSHQLPEAVSMMPVQLCPRVAMRCAASVALYPGQRHAGSHHSAFGSFAQLPSHHSAVAVSTTLLHVVFASPAAGEGLGSGAPSSFSASLQPGQWHVAVQLLSLGVLMHVWSHHSSATLSTLLLQTVFSGSGEGASVDGRWLCFPGQSHTS